MKAVKLTLAIVAVSAIIFFVIRWIGVPQEIPKIRKSNPEKERIGRIEQEIDSLKKLPDNKFSKEFYDEVTYHINDYYENGRLDSTTSGNDQIKENLTRKLYSTYVEKFTQEAFHVFRGAGWEHSDLSFIRSESRRLRSSQFLERGSPMDKRLLKIQAILRRYDEIANFISTSKRFSYLETGMDDHFPILDVEGLLDKAHSYRFYQGNEFINNCKRLQNGLKEIPQVLFNAHVSYLDKKITYWSNIYSNYNSQKTYRDITYMPLKREIQMLDNDIYNVPNFDIEYKRLTNKWEADGKNAYKYFSKEQSLQL